MVSCNLLPNISLAHHKHYSMATININKHYLIGLTLDMDIPLTKLIFLISTKKFVTLSQFVYIIWRVIDFLSLDEFRSTVLTIRSFTMRRLNDVVVCCR